MPHLRPDMFMARYLADVGSNLCQQSTRSLRFCHDVHRFFSYLQQPGHRSAVALMRGPMSAEVCNGDTNVANATFNLMTPSRQATQEQDMQYAEGSQMQSTGVQTANVLNPCYKLHDDTNPQPHHTCLVYDATDLTANATASADSNFQLTYHGHHDVSSQTGIEDEHDQQSLMAQQQQLMSPLLAILNTAQPAGSALSAAMGAAEAFIRHHNNSSMHQQVNLLQDKSNSKANRWTRRAPVIAVTLACV